MSEFPEMEKAPGSSPAPSQHRTRRKKDTELYLWWHLQPCSPGSCLPGHVPEPGASSLPAIPYSKADMGVSRLHSCDCRVETSQHGPAMVRHRDQDGRVEEVEMGVSKMKTAKRQKTGEKFTDALW